MVQLIPIIYWTKWFDTHQWEGYNIDACGLPYQCQLTHDRSQLTDSSVVIFHASDMSDKKDTPAMRKDRAWVYHNAEAPKYQPDVIDKMQYSMTYRLDSDFPWGYLEKDYLLQHMQRPVNQQQSKRKTPVAWIVSNCKASNYRHHYVRELSKWINVDIYGHCMNNQHYPDNTTTIDLISQYHFYLSFENSNCKDYVTEKLSNAYVAGTIPIVDGPSDYGPFIPNTHSVIRVDQFEHPRELAAYLQSVLADKSLYSSYFDYRRENGLADRFLSTLDAYQEGKCNLCRLAYERHTNMSLYYPGKKIYLDNTCIDYKHYSFTQTSLWRIYLPLMALVLLVSLCSSRVRRYSYSKLKSVHVPFF
ncbi:glycosyltransferase family 10 protein [Mucor lusitanicus]|uniref:Fucosyltransferase n=2 Tax=Mucor circinelloides f. lusitanicus TaxID=29924 RepID=A0A168Q3I0_MUCCL|nr:glycosyltransferase family 10 protein [Mucor lusitanicus]OAD08635.1 glycosyltransferase family 10 protein [Mucor lusitanicus CBS 277.49]